MGLLKQVIAISRPIHGRERTPEIDQATAERLSPGSAEPKVHGIDVQQKTGAADVSDDAEDACFESVASRPRLAPRRHLQP